MKERPQQFGTPTSLGDEPVQYQRRIQQVVLAMGVVVLLTAACESRKEEEPAGLVIFSWSWDFPNVGIDFGPPAKLPEKEGGCSLALRPDRSESGHKVVHVKLSSDFRVLLKITDFSGGWLEDVATGRKYQAPFLFGPGEYHLRAIKE